MATYAFTNKNAEVTISLQRNKENSTYALIIFLKKCLHRVLFEEKKQEEKMESAAGTKSVGVRNSILIGIKLK